MTSPQRLVAQQICNNNVVLVLDEKGRSIVVTGPGVGFGMRRGMLVDTAKVESVYVPESTLGAEAAADLLTRIPREVILTARGIVAEAQAVAGLPHPEVLLLPVADHLLQAVRRARQGTVISLPLVWEVRHLYPAEYSAGRRAVEIVRDKLVVELPEDEAAAFALHFVSANFTGSVIDQTVKMTQSLTDIFNALDDMLNLSIDRESEAAARFVAHLRYLFVRLSESRHVTDVPPRIQDALEESIPNAVRMAREIAEVLHSSWGGSVSENEMTYIALHIHRLVSDLECLQ